MNKWTLSAILMALCMAFVTATAQETMTRKEALCERKGIVTVYSLVHRDEFTEKEMLTLLQEDWEGSMSEMFGFASYVDMQRIIRDNYRKFGKNYKYADDEETIKQRTVREVYDCKKYGF